MNKILITIVISFVLYSCFSDLGNYDYKEINEVSISEIKNNEWYELFTYTDTLKINPKITSSLYKGGEEPYKYTWKLVKFNTEIKDNKRDDNIISNTKDLNYKLSLPAGNYNGFFFVEDTISGLVTKFDFFVRLKTLVSDGWMILCDDKGRTRLDMVINVSENQDMISRDILSDSDVKMGKPINLFFNYILQGSTRLISTDNGSFLLNDEELQTSEALNIRWRFGEIPERVVVIGSDIATRRSNRIETIVTSDNDLYVRNPRTVGSIFEFPINYDKYGKRFDVSPYFGHGDRAWGMSVILYDNTNKRFMELPDDRNFKPQLLQFAGGDVEFSAKTGRDIMFMDWTKDDYTFAVLKDNKELFYIYGIETGGSSKNYRRYYMTLKREENDIIVKFAFHPIFRYLFYATDKGDIYQYDMTRPQFTSKKVLSFPEEEISVLKFEKLLGWIAYKPWEIQRQNQLIVGTNILTEDASKSGIMRMYEVPNLMKPLELKKEYKNLGKIVSIDYRERGK